MLRFPSPYEGTLPHKIDLVWPAANTLDSAIADRIVGSLVGLAVGDALGASVEFRPREYLVEYPVREMSSGGTWGLKAGQWTDDTSMALCLASSLLAQRGFDEYDQMVRYKWWYKHGYLSSTGVCFDIGNATRESLEEFRRRQNALKKNLKVRKDVEVDKLRREVILQEKFDVNCSGEGAAGNGALMRLAPVPLFFYQEPHLAVELSGRSARLTHGDVLAIDACRYYGALIVAAVQGAHKDELLRNDFCDAHRAWFGGRPLHPDILTIANGSYKQSAGYNGGIRGKGYVTMELEAALWAFWSSNSFEQGALNAVNLGDDTDTTAAIYGQLAGAYYGYRGIPQRWRDILYAHDLIVCIGQWIQVVSYPKGEQQRHRRISRIRSQSVDEIKLSDRSNFIEPGLRHSPASKRPMAKRELIPATAASKKSSYKIFFASCFGQRHHLD